MGGNAEPRLLKNWDKKVTKNGRRWICQGFKTINFQGKISLPKKIPQALTDVAKVF